MRETWLITDVGDASNLHVPIASAEEGRVMSSAGTMGERLRIAITRRCSTVSLRRLRFIGWKPNKINYVYNCDGSLTVM